MTTCQFQIKFITDNYLQMYKTLQYLQTHLHINKFTSIKVIKNTKLIKDWIKLNLFLP